MSSKSGTHSFVISESSVHYIAALLDREQERYPSKHHVDALKEMRELSNKLLETLEEPMQIGIHRHRLGK